MPYDWLYWHLEWVIGERGLKDKEVCIMSPPIFSGCAVLKCLTAPLTSHHRFFKSFSMPIYYGELFWRAPFWGEKNADKSPNQSVDEHHGRTFLHLSDLRVLVWFSTVACQINCPKKDVRKSLPILFRTLYLLCLQCTINARYYPQRSPQWNKISRAHGMHMYSHCVTCQL